VIKSIVKDFSISYLTQVSIGLTGIILMFYLTRNFGVEGYGEISVIKRSSELLWTFCLLGLTVSIPRNKSFIDKIEKGYLEKIIVYILPILLVAGYLLSSHLSFLLLGRLFDEYRYLFVVIVISSMIIGIVFAYFRATQEFLKANIIQTLAYSVAPLIPLFFSTTTYQYMTYFSYLLLGLSSLVLIYLIAVLKIRSYTLKIDNISVFFVQMRFLLSYGIRRVPGIIAASLIFTLPLVMLNKYGTPIDVGYYSQFTNIMSVINLPVGSLGIVLLPRISNMINAIGIKQVSYYINKSKIIFLHVLLWLGLFVVYFISEIISVISGYDVKLTNFDQLIVSSGIFVVLYNLFRNPIDAASYNAYSTRNIFISIMNGLFSYLVLVNILSVTDAIKCAVAISYFSLGIGSIILINKLYSTETIRPNSYDIILLGCYIGLSSLGFTMILNVQSKFILLTILLLISFMLIRRDILYFVTDYKQQRKYSKDGQYE